MKIKFGVFLVILFLVATFIVTNQENNDNKVYKARIGLYSGTASSLMIAAQKLRYLKDENLDIEIKYYSSGKAAMEGMLKNEVDYSNCTDFVAVKNSFTKKDFKILTSMADASINGMLAKKSSGILTPKDIKGKKVGTTIGTATEYYTGVFLEQNELNLKDVELINVPRKKRYEVMEEDKVDALFAWEPFIYNLRNKYKDEITYYPMSLGFEFYFVFVVNESFHQNNKIVSSKILKALKKAEEFKNKNKKEFEKIVKEHFNFDDEYLKYIVQKHDFRLVFPHTLTTILTNQAHWLDTNNLVKGTKVKSFYDLYDTSLLKKIKPFSVTVME